MNTIPQRLINALALVAILAAVTGFTTTMQVEAKTSVKAETYISMAGDAAADLRDIFGDLQTINESVMNNPYLASDPETIGNIGRLFGKIDGIAIVFNDLKAPSGYSTIHTEFTAALADYSKAGDAYIPAMINLDADGLNTALAYMTSGNEHVQEATRLIKAKS